MMMRTMWDYTIRGRSWDDISEGHGLERQPVTVHFNRRCTNIIAAPIESWLEGAASHI
jgi:hypothetical protein